MSFDLYLDPTTNDIVFEDGLFRAVSSNRELLRQRLFIRLSTFLGEWFVNTEFGVPYRQSILKKNITKTLVDAILISKINEEALVEELISFSSELNRPDRVYSVDFIVAVEPATISNPLTQIPSAEWDYPYSDPNNPRATCLEGLSTQSNDLYEHINFELPLDGISTWWNQWSQYIQPSSPEFTSTNDLYSELNQDIPQSGSGTWWNGWVPINPV